MSVSNVGEFEHLDASCLLFTGIMQQSDTGLYVLNINECVINEPTPQPLSKNPKDNSKTQFLGVHVVCVQKRCVGI